VGLLGGVRPHKPNIKIRYFAQRIGSFSRFLLGNFITIKVLSYGKNRKVAFCVVVPYLKARMYVFINIFYRYFFPGGIGFRDLIMKMSFISRWLRRFRRFFFWKRILPLRLEDAKAWQKSVRCRLLCCFVPKGTGIGFRYCFFYRYFVPSGTGFRDLIMKMIFISHRLRRFRRFFFWKRVLPLRLEDAKFFSREQDSYLWDVFESSDQGEIK